MNHFHMYRVGHSVFVALHEFYRGQGVPVLDVHAMNFRDAAQAYCDRYGLTYRDMVEVHTGVYRIETGERDI